MFDPSGTGTQWDIGGRIDLYDGEELTLKTNAKVNTARLDLLHYRRYHRPAYTWVRPGLFDGYFWSWENISYVEAEPGMILLVYDLQNWIEYPGADAKKAIRGVWITRET